MESKNHCRDSKCPNLTNQNGVLSTVCKRRVLYDEARKYPANHIDNSFLQGLQKNVNMKTYYLYDAIVNTSVVSQELNSISTIFSSFYLLDNQLISEGSLFTSSTIIIICFYIAFESHWSLPSVYEHVKRAFVYLAFILGLSPVLKTLTDTVSTDSIYFMSIMLMIIHLLTYDYGLNIALTSPSVSLTAAFAASVTLASRLPTTFSVFEFLCFAVEIVALFPRLRKKIQTRYQKGRIFLTCVITLIGGLATWCMSPILATILFILEIFINLICPVLFIRWQKYKDNIYGPWDEATLSDGHKMHLVN